MSLLQWRKLKFWEAHYLLKVNQTMEELGFELSSDSRAQTLNDQIYSLLDMPSGNL